MDGYLMLDNWHLRVGEGNALYMRYEWAGETVNEFPTRDENGEITYTHKDDLSERIKRSFLSELNIARAQGKPYSNDLLSAP